MRLVFAIAALTAATLPRPAAADVDVAFYSRPGDGPTFPHAFVTMHGAIGTPPSRIDRAIGFTASRVSLDIVSGPVPGNVVIEPPAFIARSQRHLTFRISDDRYRRVDAAIRRWKAAPQPSYRLDSRNCVDFVAAVARAAELNVPPLRHFRRDPHAFMVALAAANRHRKTLSITAI